MNRCNNPKCNKIVKRRNQMGPAPRFCSGKCTRAAYKTRKRNGEVTCRGGGLELVYDPDDSWIVGRQFTLGSVVSDLRFEGTKGGERIWAEGTKFVRTPKPKNGPPGILTVRQCQLWTEAGRPAK